MCQSPKDQARSFLVDKLPSGFATAKVNLILVPAEKKGTMHEIDHVKFSTWAVQPVNVRFNLLVRLNILVY